MNYYGYRYYNPALGRWVNRDPLGLAGGGNLYAYVQNDPVNFVDPWGWLNMISRDLKYTQEAKSISIGARGKNQEVEER